MSTPPPAYSTSKEPPLSLPLPPYPNNAEPLNYTESSMAIDYPYPIDKNQSNITSSSSPRPPLSYTETSMAIGYPYPIDKNQSNITSSSSPRPYELDWSPPIPPILQQATTPSCTTPSSPTDSASSPDNDYVHCPSCGSRQFRSVYSRGVCIVLWLSLVLILPLGLIMAFVLCLYPRRVCIQCNKHF